ncbi:sugar phosphate isomerase/epimerase family protein [Spongiimicrobium sp. 3-5]|uniref:sugar phosphate isomerase/epimerase family protein n=1 Tax=Spongiimicrobium sp. 3-5 TaxID=3332596 RepID=UPI003980B7B8
MERSPIERIRMLKSMGFTKYGYNWDLGNLNEMKAEFKIAKEHNVEIVSIFLWLNAERDSVGKFSPSNERMLSILKDVENKPTIWVSFSNNYFNNLDQEQSISLAIDFIKFVKLRADEIGCNLALYNHHGWFGNPYNQVEIIERMPEDSLKIIYNFHHAHHYLDEFPKIVKKIKAYLSYVNINGIRKEGPQILTIGEGDFENEMINILRDEGFEGPWGILGHIKSEDVQKVLERNMNGLKSLKPRIN